MPIAKKKRPTCRVNLEMSQAVRDKLDTLSDASNANLSEVIRKSLAIYDLLYSETQNGGKIIIRTDKKEKEVVII